MIVRCKCGSIMEFTKEHYDKYSVKQLVKALEAYLGVHQSCYKDEWDEERMDIIGQNGNSGEHYDM